MTTNRTQVKGNIMGKIVNYTNTPKASAYANDVAELIAAGEGKATVITIAADKIKENGKSDNSVSNAKRAFQTAARAAQRTARIVNTVTDGESVDLTFTLRPTKSATTAEENITDIEYPKVAQQSKK